MRRWKCERCGSGVTAPDKPRMDDVRRYCLSCSAKTGKLVKRTCPALERKRAASKETSAERAKRQRERERANAPWMHSGVDMRKVAKRFWNLPSIKEQHKGRRMPPITWRHSQYHSSGNANGYRVIVTMGPNLHGAQSVLLHELVHAALHLGGKWGREEMRTPTGKIRHHGALFQSVERSAGREAWPHRDAA